METMKKNLTTGSVLKNIIRFSLPYLLSYFLQTLYGMADLFITGQFEGTASITAVSIGSQVMHMLTVMIVGLAMGTTVNIAQAVGAQENERAAKTIGNTVILFMGLSIILTVALLMLVRPIVFAMSTPAEAVEGTVRYLTVCFIGIPFITAYNIISSIFRGLGDSRSPMYFIAVACVINIGLDYFFVGGMKLGPLGVALGTTLAQTVSVIVSLLMIRKRKAEMALDQSCFKPQMGIMRPILRVGLPVAFQDGFIQIAFIVITIIANQRGLQDAAAVGIVEKIIGFLFLVPSSMLSTVSAICAQNIGAGKHERAEATLRYAIMICVGFGLAAAVVVQFFAGSTVGLFDKNAEVIALGSQYLRGYVWDCVFAGMHFCFSGYFCACARSRLSFLHNLLSIILIRIPGAYLMSGMFADTLFPMGLAVAAGSLFSVFVCVIAFYRMKRA